MLHCYRTYIVLLVDIHLTQLVSSVGSDRCAAAAATAATEALRIHEGIVLLLLIIFATIEVAPTTATTTPETKR
tara:strand:- start:696 stop:917 length:222 start_codon:yes stop_codon:yes gene_type:complete